MKSIPRTIISFIGICLFSVSYGIEFPDEGRLKVGECLSEILSWKEDKIKNLEDNLGNFCTSTFSDKLFVVKELQKIGKGPEKGYEELQKCLKNDAEKLLKRYYNEISTSILDITRVTESFCEEKHFIKFDDLDDNEKGKAKAMQCFQDCAVKLFKKYEFLYTCLRRKLEERRGKGEPNPLLKAEVNVKEGDTSDQSEDSVPIRVSPDDFRLVINTGQYEEECKKEKVKDIYTLSIIGEKYMKEYVMVVDALYEANPIFEEKEKPFKIIQSYFSCIRWRCAMAQEQDIPIRDFLSDILQRKNENPFVN